MHQDDTYTTQATNDKNEDAPTDIATAVNFDDAQPGDPDS